MVATKTECVYMTVDAASLQGRKPRKKWDIVYTIFSRKIMRKWKQPSRKPSTSMGCNQQQTFEDGTKLPRWKPRSTNCQLMGLSNRNASSVPLVLLALWMKK